MKKTIKNKGKIGEKQKNLFLQTGALNEQTWAL